LGAVLHPVFADHHVHLGLVDASGLAESGIGRVVDLGWSDAVVAIAGSAPVETSYAGRFVAAPGGYPAASRWAPPRCTSEVAEPRDAAAAVAHQVSLGASVVKTTLNRDAGPVPDLATLSAVVDAAGGAGLSVVAHCQGPGMVELALAAGVSALAHTPWTHRLDDEVVAEAVEAGQAWVSTLDIHGHGSASPDQDRAVDNLARFHAAGGRVLYGTDLGNGPLPEALNPREVGLLTQAGLTDDGLVAALADPWPFAEPVTGLATEVPDGPGPLAERLARARVVPTDEEA
jgi:imidazolonepropionase-like amidohydrolase